jgi:uncharacterized protein YbjT (DUF2867 family)
MKVLVIGATGTIGREVVSQLLPTGAHVRAMSRTPGRAQLPPEVELVRGDLTDPPTLDRALDGIDAVFLVWTAPPAAAPAAIERVAKHVPRLVYLSAPYKTPHPFFQQPNAGARMVAEIERLIEASGVRWTFLRPGMFAANAIGWWASQIHKGDVVRWPYADAPTAPVHERDIGAVAVRTLLDDRLGNDYVLTGPQSLTQREQVAIIGEAIGRPLRYEELSPAEARTELGFPPPVADMLFNAWSAAIGQPAYITRSVEDITGRPARSFREWADDHAADFR